MKYFIHSDEEIQIIQERADNEKVVRLITSLSEELENQEAEVIVLNLAKIRNLVRMAVAGIEIQDDVLETMFGNKDIIPVDESKLTGVANSVFESARKKYAEGTTMMLAGTPETLKVLKLIAEKCMQNGIPFSMDVNDPNLFVAATTEANDEGLSNLGTSMGMQIAASSVKAHIDFENGMRKRLVPQNMQKVARRIFEVNNGNPSKSYCLASIPSMTEAEIDSASDYASYLEMYFAACDQPWNEIREEQRLLIEELNKCSVIRITSISGTDVTFNVSGFTFANSVTSSNVPGAEVFSAPHLDGVDGVIIANGNFMRNGKKMRNLRLRFEQGILVEYSAEEGNEELSSVINSDPAMTKVGEIAFGNNPGLKEHTVNSLLVEKVGGSFHIALGRCYTYESYDGVPVNLDNGNHSNVPHWDITSLLKGQESTVYFDGRVAQKNGIWVDQNGQPDPRFATINFGKSKD